MTFTETLMAFGLMSAMIAGVMLAVIFVLKFFVGLKSPPIHRTLMTVGTAYVVGVTGFMFGGLPEYQLWAPLLGLPWLIILGWTEYRSFKARWFDNVEDMPEGTKLTNDDWTVGFFLIAALVLAALIKVLLREM